MSKGTRKPVARSVVPRSPAARCAPTSATPKRRNDLVICLLLIAATLAVFAQIARFDFINYDDSDYVTRNFHVREGLTGKSVAWAFTSAFASNWFPLTWLSHMADCQFFGLQSGLHHLSSLWLHLLSTLLLYLTLRRMTGAYWPSAFTAFIFGTHPLHVESVAWISERKDVLCGFFWMLTLWSYVRYTERPGWRRYALTLLTFVFGLMAKPMIVTLPLQLLLLDFWPLQRIANTKRAVLEKVPFLLLSAMVSVITYNVQASGGAVIPLGALPFWARVGNALTSYVTYLTQTFLPVNLAVFYPFSDNFPAWKGLAAALTLIAISLLVLRYTRRRPYLLTGWLWYLITLLPVIGLVQAGNQAHADRYTYVPMIGLCIIAAWGGAEIVERRPNLKPVILASGGLLCVACVLVGWRQTQFWRDSASLFRHAIAVTEGNYVAWSGLGHALKDEGRMEDATNSYRQAIAAKPLDPDAHNNLGEVLLILGQTDSAVEQIVEALRLKPDLVEARVNLGAAFSKTGRVDEAASQYREALRLQPENAAAHAGEAAVLEDSGRRDAAMDELREAIRLNPEYAPAHYNLGRLLGTSGHPAEAAREFAEAVRLQPGNASNHLNLGIALAAQGKLDEATAEFRTAVRLDPNHAGAHFNLGTALAQSGRMDEAIGQFSEALRLQPDFVQARESLENARALQGAGAR